LPGDTYFIDSLKPILFVGGFFSKPARSVLRYIRVASKEGLKNRITAATFTTTPDTHSLPIIPEPMKPAVAN
jgi:hypothetical protein